VSALPPAVDVGDRAPAFRLRHTFDDDVDLAERLQHGPVVLHFYVFDFGSV
jgi:peroxiredoxin